MKLKALLSLIPLSIALFSNNVLALTQEQELENLQAFSKLYGYVKYFHPSDEASSIDWDKFAIYGAKKVKNAENNKELKKILEEIFLPIAPTSQIYFSNEKPDDFKSYLKDDKNLKVVAWQHQGVGSLSTNSIYSSLRTNIDNIIINNKDYFGMISQSIDAKNLQGKEFKFKAFVKTDVKGINNQSQLWLRVDRESKQAGFINSMDDRPIKLKKWKEYEISGKIDNDAESISFGTFLVGIGKLWIDNLQLLVKENNKWVPVNIKNGDFELSTKDGFPESWSVSKEDHISKTTSDDFYTGKKSLLIQNKLQTFNGALFEKYPNVGEVINKKINDELSCQIPLSLYTDGKITIGKNNKFSFSSFSNDFDSFEINNLNAKNEDFRLGDTIIVWNVLQHFYPYFDVVKVDWNQELINTLKKTLKDKNNEDFLVTLKVLVEKLQDGHGNVSFYDYQKEQPLLFPFFVTWAENQVIITNSQTGNLKKGDIILSIDGKKAEDILIDSEKLISGSKQWKRFNSLRQFSMGDKNKKSKIEIKRDNEIFFLTLERNLPSYTRNNEFKRKNIEKLDNNIYYVDLDAAKIKELEEKIEEFSNAKGIIFDLRGYPEETEDIITHLINKPVMSAIWNIPQIIYPDQENIVGFNTKGRWNLKPKSPRFNGKIVFLIDGRTISQAESFMGIIENYKLAEIIGETTAGANGNVNKITLPGNFNISWTGMKVLKHDKSQHHLIGIKPTIPLKRTIKGIKEGKDELFDKAIELINLN